MTPPEGWTKADGTVDDCSPVFMRSTYDMVVVGERACGDWYLINNYQAVPPEGPYKFHEALAMADTMNGLDEYFPGWAKP